MEAKEQVKISLPRSVDWIIYKLEENGYEAYAVGGCTRDALLGRKPKDWDITTSALPVQVKQIFKRTIDTGIEHGTVTVMVDHVGYEVTTYRVDGEYEDARHPKEVSFTGNLRDDLLRRDFTINAMAYHPRIGLVDAFDGLKDLKEQRIRAVGVAMDRFGEDALRILRAIRFAAQLSFEIEEQTMEAMKQLAPNLKKISAERIREEYNKLLLSGHALKLVLAQELGINQIVLPEFSDLFATAQNNPHHCYDVALHSLHGVEEVCRLYEESGRKEEKELCVLVWTMLLHDVGKAQTKTTDEKGIDHFYGHQQKGCKMAKTILRRLKFDNYTINEVCRLVDAHDDRPVSKRSSVRKKMNRVGDERMDLLYLVQKADVLAQSEFEKERKLNDINEEQKLCEQIRRDAECVNIRNLAVNGNDLIKAGVKPGKMIGEILNRLLEAVLEDSSLNDKDILLGMLEQQTKVQS